MQKTSSRLAILSLFSISMLSLSPSALSQTYGAVVGDLNAIFEPPMNIQGTICDSTLNQGLEHSYKACADGVAASRWMAEKYAKGAGEYLGCLDGFYQGIWDGYTNSSEPTQEMMSEAQNFVRNARFDSAERRATERAVSEGNTVSADQIIKRYRDVIGLKDDRGRQVMPDKTYHYPAITFNGFEDGYETDVSSFSGQNGLDFSPVYQSRWVTPQSNFRERVAARRIHQLQGQHARNLCDPSQTIFGRRSMPQLTIWDYFKAKRSYNFQNYGWKNPDWAWEIFDRDEKTLEQYQTFTRLGTLEKVVTENVPVYENRLKLDSAGNPIRVLDAAGQPALDGQGRPTFEMERIVVGQRTETRRVKLSDAEVTQLKNLYISSFKTAYERFYARQYASINYHKEGLNRYNQAKLIGTLIGQDVASHVARREAYNQQYKLQSAKTFASAVKRLYELSFNRLINIFQTNPVLELNEARIIGEVNDGIFRPGEMLRVDMQVTNLGEVSRPSVLSFSDSTDVIAIRNGFNFSVPALSMEQLSSTPIAQITNDRFAKDQITATMNISNPGNLLEIATSINARKNQRIIVNDYTEIENVSSQVAINEGRLDLVVELHNPSNVTSPFISDIELNVSGIGTLSSVSVEPIAAKSKKTIALTTNKVDPLVLIQNRSIQGQISVKLGNRTAHRQSFSKSLNNNSREMIASYFDSLVTAKTSNSGNESKEDRIQTIVSMISEDTKNHIDNRLIWRKGEEFDQTLIKALQDVYNTSKRARQINDEAQRFYQELGEALAPMVKNLKSRGLFNDSRNKKEYLKAISVFAPRIETNHNRY